jgi:hypothetical protein
MGAVHNNDIHNESPNAVPPVRKSLMRINSLIAAPAVESTHPAAGRGRMRLRGRRPCPTVPRRIRSKASIRQERAMATANTPIPPIVEDEVPEEPIPAMQLLLDNPFLLLFIGIAMPTVLYIVWGVMEIVGIPIAK